MEDEDFDGEAIIDELDQGIDDALDQFGAEVSDAEAQLLGRVQDRLGAFAVDAQGNIVKSVQNLRAINDVRRELQAAQNSGAYSQAVRGLVAQFSVQAKTLDRYFGQLRLDFGKGKKLYGAIVDEYITATAAQLYTGALGNSLATPVLDILRTHVTTGAPIKELRAQVAQVFEGDRILSNQAEAVADNALNQFSRNYIQAVSDDLGLRHYFYKGTKIATSRPFCVQRIGKYFTEEEVLSWGDLSFAGKIKGTDRANIKTNLGGHRCRHRLIPITLALYNAKTGRSGQLALF